MGLEEAIKQLGPSLSLGFVGDEPDEPWCVRRQGSYDPDGNIASAGGCVAHGATWP